MPTPRFPVRRPRRFSLGAAFGILLFTAATVAAQDLMQSYTQALDHAPELKAAQAGVEINKSIEQQNQAKRLPSININGSYIRDRQETLNSASQFFANGTEYFSTKNAALRASQALYQPTNSLRVHIARKDTENSRLQLEINRQQLLFSVAQRYFSVLSALDSLHFSQAEKKAIAEQHKRAQQGYELGINAITDKQEAQARYDLAAANLIRAENTLLDAKEALAEITGITVGTVSTLAPAAFETLSGQPEKDWESATIDNNLSLKSSMLAVQQSQQLIQLNRLQRLPSVSLTAVHQYNETSGGNFGDRATTDTTVGIEFNVPIYNGGEVSSRIKTTAQQQVQAQYRYEQLRRLVIRQIREDFRQKQLSKRMIQALKQAVQSNKTALEAAKAGLDVGSRTTIDVLNAQQALFRAKRDYAQTRYDYLLADLKLRLTSGQLTAANLADINQHLNP